VFFIDEYRVPKPENFLILLFERQTAAFRALKTKI